MEFSSSAYTINFLIHSKFFLYLIYHLVATKERYQGSITWKFRTLVSPPSSSKLLDHIQRCLTWWLSAHQSCWGLFRPPPTTYEYRVIKDLFILLNKYNVYIYYLPMQLHTVIRRWVIQPKTLCAMNRSIMPYTLSSSISTLRTGISIYISECSIFEA